MGEDAGLYHYGVVAPFLERVAHIEHLGCGYAGYLAEPLDAVGLVYALAGYVDRGRAARRLGELRQAPFQRYAQGIALLARRVPFLLLFQRRLLPDTLS